MDAATVLLVYALVFVEVLDGRSFSVIRYPHYQYLRTTSHVFGPRLAIIAQETHGKTSNQGTHGRENPPTLRGGGFPSIASTDQLSFSIPPDRHPPTSQPQVPQIPAILIAMSIPPAAIQSAQTQEAAVNDSLEGFAPDPAWSLQTEIESLALANGCLRGDAVAVRAMLENGANSTVRKDSFYAESPSSLVEFV